jgi:uncharacterized protein
MQTRMPVELPDTANFQRQVELGSTLSGEVSISRFPRLSEMLVSDDGSAMASLVFGYSAGYASVKGSITADLKVECQRCLQPMDLKVDSRFKFAFVHDEDEFDLIPDEFEPYIIEGDEQSVIDILEDELLLSVPMVPVHDERCSEFMSVHEQDKQAEREASHPFAALKALKVKDKSDDKVN